MIVVTGADGFIGSNIIDLLDQMGRRDLLAVDVFRPYARYLDTLCVRDRCNKDELLSWLRNDANPHVEVVFHLGACSDTTETDVDFLAENNTEYTKTLWKLCAKRSIPFIYASSAATYGDGSHGFDDECDLRRLKPLNEYGRSKHAFDLWAVKQKVTPPRWAGLKYFNVYGPRESHKGRMASMAFHAYNQIRDTGAVRLFKSYVEGVPDGGQLRDFVYIDDAVYATLHFWQNRYAPSGLYNVGTGKSWSFSDLAKAVFTSMVRGPDIVYIPMPEDLRKNYQYLTQATTTKLRRAGFREPFRDIESGVKRYVKWLTKENP